MLTLGSAARRCRWTSFTTTSTLSTSRASSGPAPPMGLIARARALSLSRALALSLSRALALALSLSLSLALSRSLAHSLSEGGCRCRIKFLGFRVDKHIVYFESDFGYLRLIDSCITQIKAQGPSRTCNESKEEEEEATNTLSTSRASSGRTPPSRI